ncbi:MAG: glycosyltransferase family 4 protein [Sporomusaceae bacterium]|nr:glycosyltransferase family 4 protein [Sporomusaceae bacterium]
MGARKLLYVITTGSLGGAQRHLADLISCLPASYEVHVALGQSGWLGDRLAAAGASLHLLPELVQPLAMKQDIRTLWELKKLIQTLQPDLIHCHSSKAGFLGRIAGRFSATPVVFTVHGWAFTEGISWPKRLIYRLAEQIAAAGTSRFICVSDYDRQLGVRAMPGCRHKMLTIHNGVEAQRQLSCSSQNQSGQVARQGNGPVRLVMVARFNQQKDQALLLQALAKLLKREVLAEVSFVGDGPTLPEATTLAAELGITDQVHFLGARDDVVAILAEQDVFVLASKWEGFPISILEAMRQGLPVIASDVGGVKEAVTDRETGFLTPRGDLTALASRLWELCLNPRLRIQFGQAGRRRYEQEFTLPLMAEKTLQVYEQVLLGR